MTEPFDAAALAAGWMQVCRDTARLHHLQGPGLQGLLVERFWGWEALNEPYEWFVHVLTPRADLSLEGWLDSRAELHTVGAQGQRYRLSGHIAQARALACNGALARYELLIVPWLWRLRLGGRPRAWQHCSLRHIIDDVLAGYQPRAAWRWSAEVDAHLEALGPWDYVVQGRESDLAFVQRLLARAGLGLRFEEVDGDDDAPGLGHRAVLFAHSPDPQACPEHPDSARWGAIAYHRAHSQEPRDSVQTYQEHACHTPGVHTALGWHDSAKRAITAQAPGAAAAAAAYEDYELHSAPDSASAAARARLRGQALQTQALHYSGQATVRGARCGQWWRLSHLPGRAQPQELLLTELIHVGDNPLPHAVHNAAAALSPAPLGEDRLAPARPIEPGVLAQARASGYAQHWRAVPRQSPWRPMPPSAPSAAGPQSAVVVGPDGQPQAPEGSALHTDRLGRIKVRFHWQAAAAAFPPACGGEPRNEPCREHSVWVRVAQRWAGAGMGTQFIPRIGQEVLVDFIERDLERPVVVGVLHNGRGAGGVSPTPGGRAPRTPQGQPFAAAGDHRSAGQANDVAGGHSPAWHGAAAQPHAHAGALSGVQSRELGGWGANRLVFDDSPGQLRVQAATTAHATWLSLGHLLHQAGNRRGSVRGLGLELRTDAYGALRGACGLLLSSYGQAPHERAGDPSAGLALLHQAQAQADTLAHAAQRHHNATLGPTRQALQALQRSLQGRVSARWDSAPSAAPAPPAGELPHSATPIVQAQARAQQVWTAGQDVIASAEHSVHLGAGQDQHHSAGGAWRVHSGQALSVLAGAAPAAAEPAGLSLVAAQGQVQLQAQSDRLELAAQQALDIQSAAAHLDATAARSITLATADGARITLSAQGLQVHCPGTLRIQAAQIRMLGAQRVQPPMPLMPQGELSLPQDFPFSV